MTDEKYETSDQDQHKLENVGPIWTELSEHQVVRGFLIVLSWYKNAGENLLRYDNLMPPLNFRFETERFGRSLYRPANIIDGCIFVQYEITFDDGHVSISCENRINPSPEYFAEP